MTIDADSYARMVPGRDPVHTVAARELLLDALAGYDAGIYQVPTVWVDERPEPTAWSVARRAVADAEIAHDLLPWSPGPGMGDPDPDGVDDHVAAVELAVLELERRIRTGDKRRPVRPL
jgi:hypothetical protein